MRTPGTTITQFLAGITALVMAAGSLGGAPSVIFSDHFDTTGIDVNADLATRQSGTLATSTYAYYYSGGNSISGNELYTKSDSGFYNNADFESALTDPGISGFTLSFDARNTGNDWISPFLSTHPGGGDDRGATRFGLIIFASGTVGAYGDSGTGQSTTALGAAPLTAKLGSWNVAAMNSYSLVATATTASTGTYDLFINGTEVLSDIPYDLGTGGSNGELNWENRNIAGGVGYYDNLVLTTWSGSTAEPKITSVTKSGTTVTVQFEGIDGQSYDLNKSTTTDFTTPDIKDAVPLSGTTSGTLEDTSATEDKAFYRVEQQ